MVVSANQSRISAEDMVRAHLLERSKARNSGFPSATEHRESTGYKGSESPKTIVSGLHSYAASAG